MVYYMLLDAILGQHALYDAIFGLEALGALKYKIILVDPPRPSVDRE